MIQIVLVEDNIDLREEVSFFLRRQQHQVTDLADGEALNHHLRTATPDVLILDIGLPGESGLDIAARLRPLYPMMAIAMLTARGQVEDRMAGFDRGADIYLVKPVDLRELSVVVESLYRRMHRNSRPERQQYWQLDCQTLELVSPGGDGVLLTPTEFKLMRVLADSAPEAVKRGDLVEALGQRQFDFDYRRLETAMSRLRKKIEGPGEQSSPLRSARNVGYAFVAPIRIWEP